MVNRCKHCGTPYKLTPVVYDLFGKTRDHSYYAPYCNCKEKIEEKEKNRELGQKQASRIRSLLDCGISPVYKNKTFSNFDQSQNPIAYKKCKDYAKKFGRDSRKSGLLLIGLVGTGKTHMASAIVNYVARLRHRVIKSFIKFVSVSELIDEIRNTKNLSRYWSGVNTCDLLVLDDLGAEYSTHWSKKMVQKIIDIRYKSKKATVITTNLSIEGIKVEYEERTSSRICEMCTAAILEGDDYRLMMKNENELL